MVEIQDIQRIFQQRVIWQIGYKNVELETKRRSAIIWLRHCSRKGWVVDRILRRAV